MLYGLLYGLLYDFNPRSRKGSDNLGYICSMPVLNFNPRSRKGSDRPCRILKTT